MVWARDAAPFVALDRNENGVHFIEASFNVNVPPATAWAVLTDYEGIPSFVSSMKSSRILRRDPDAILVEQTAVGRYLWFGKSMRVLLRVSENPPSSIKFEDVAGKDFKYYRGEWALSSTDEGTWVVYRLGVENRGATPGFVKTRAIRQNVTELLQEVRAEMRRRHPS